MTTITIYTTTDGEYKGISCKGHAGYSYSGKDIVCSAISVLVINSVNSWEKLTHEEMKSRTDSKRGIIECKFTKPLSEDGILLMKSLILGLKGIVKDYGKKYLELKFKEV